MTLKIMKSILFGLRTGALGSLGLSEAWEDRVERFALSPPLGVQ